jgi:hypothetical protein
MKAVNERKNVFPIKSTKGKKINNPLMILILVFLIIQVLISGYQLYATITRDIRRTKLTQAVAEYTAGLDGLTDQLLSDFKEDVYNNPNVDSTAKQAVMASEYNFNAILLLAKQNSRIMEILTQFQ